MTAGAFSAQAHTARVPAYRAGLVGVTISQASQWHPGGRDGCVDCLCNLSAMLAVNPCSHLCTITAPCGSCHALIPFCAGLGKTIMTIALLAHLACEKCVHHPVMTLYHLLLRLIRVICITLFGLRLQLCMPGEYGVRISLSSPPA